MSQAGCHIVCSTCGAINRVADGKQLTDGKCGKCATALAAPSPIEIDDDTLFRLMARDHGAFVLDVWAPWCGPCRAMAPAYKEAALAMKQDARFFKLNSDQHPKAAGELGVRGIPALFIFNRGRKIAQHAGAMPAKDLIAWVKHALATNS